MIQNERQFMASMRQWGAANEAILRLLRTPVNQVTKDLGYPVTVSGDLCDFLLAESELNRLTEQRDELRSNLDEYDQRVHGDRTGQWMPMHTGTRFWPEDPRPQDIDIRDIAHSLASINRYNGHTKRPFSVAQHCVLGSEVINQRYALQFLMHDAGECYLGDVVTPIKRLFREFYEATEQKVMDAVGARYDFSYDEATNHLVKRMDLIMLATEVRDLTTMGVLPNPLRELPLDQKIRECWPPKEAKRRFLSRFEELTSARATK